MRNFASARSVALAVLLSALALVGCTTLTSVPHYSPDGILERVEYIDSLDYLSRVEHFRPDGTREQVEYYYTGFCHYCSIEELQQFKRLKRVDHYSPHQVLEHSFEYSFSGELRKARSFRLDGGLEQVDYFYRDGTVEMSEHYAFGGVVRQVDEFRPNGTLRLQVFLSTEGELVQRQLFASDGKTLEQVTLPTPD